MREEIITKLIGFNTINDHNNKEINEYLISLLECKGFTAKRIYNYENSKYCVLLQYKEPVLTLVGHTDTVSCSDKWNTNPFKLVKKDNKYYGLGTCDMKGGIASFISAILEIDLESLKKGFSVLLTYDEEIGFEGANLINPDILAENIVIAEPTNNIPIVGTKGLVEYVINFKGIRVHSSLAPKGRNAILDAMNFVREINKYSEELKEEKKYGYEIPYATFNLGTINGGVYSNIVPDECEITFDFRTITNEQNSQIVKKINRISSKYNCEVTLRLNMYGADFKDKDIIPVFEKITDNERGYFFGITEGSIFNRKNTLIFGVGPVNAHEPNEYIDVTSYNQCIEAYKKIIEYFCK